MGHAEHTRSKRNRSIIISVTISVTILTSALLIWLVKVKKDKRKGESFYLATYKQLSMIYLPEVFSRIACVCVSQI